MKKCAAVIAGLALAAASFAIAGESTVTTGPDTRIHTQSPLAALNADDIEGRNIVDTAGRVDRFKKKYDQAGR